MNVKNQQVSIYSVAKKAGVSAATVSRILNQSASVNLQTRQRVLTIMEEMQFRPRQSRNRAGQIGFVMIRDLVSSMDHYSSTIMQGIMNFCSEAGIDLSMIHLSPAQAESEMVVKTVMEHGCDVVILIGKHSHFISYMQRAGIPVIIIGDQVDASGVYYVDADNEQGTRQAMEFLIGQGHRRIVLFCANMSSKDHEDRLKVYCQVLAENNISFDPELVVKLTHRVASMEAGRLMAQDYFSGQFNATAALAMSDEMVYGMLRYLNDAGIRVPADISIVGFDDYELSRYIEPPLTTVHQPLFEMGEYAAKSALRLINGGTMESVNKILPAELVIRKSVKKLQP